MNQEEKKPKCNGNCGMNYCDEYGCIENKPDGDVSHLLNKPQEQKPSMTEEIKTVITLREVDYNLERMIFPLFCIPTWDVRNKEEFRWGHAGMVNSVIRGQGKYFEIVKSEPDKQDGKPERMFAAVSPNGMSLAEGWYKDANGNDFQLIKIIQP